ncbi:MAG: PASTA domain-containing protein [Streptococcus gallolyticus]|uniref:PASTA domain-containing protein n=1 Tax=Streptococcus gallolyticus TaxID=315405 RepID=A0A927X9P7_9STRE|nr:PASTA domain-containing protein [Streptococcus gallolyticus]
MNQEDYEKQQEMEKLLENDRNQRINQVKQLQNQNILEQERLNNEKLRYQEELLREQNTLQFEKEMDDRIFQLRMTLAQTSDTLSRNDLQALLNEEEAKRDRYYAEKEARRKAAEQEKVVKEQELAKKPDKGKGKKSNKKKKSNTNTLATIVLGILTLVAVIILVTVYKSYKQKYATESTSSTSTTTVHKSSVASTTSDTKKQSSTRSKQASSSQKVSSKSSSKIKNSVSASSSKKVTSSSSIGSRASKDSSGFKIKDYTGQDYKIAVKDLVNNYSISESQIEIEEISTSDYKEGLIISQSPSQGETFKVGGDDKIVFKVAVESTVAMPNLTGYTYSEAVSALTALGVSSSHITVYQADPNSSTGYVQVSSPSSTATVTAQTPYYGETLSGNVVLYLAADEE